MNLPNKITMLRVFLIPVFLVLFLVEQIPFHNYFALVVFVVACITDAVDGKIARKYNLVTNFGKFMDPLADKLLVCSALICFVDLHYLNVIIAIVIIAREFIISGFRLVASDAGVVLAASYWGKVKTTVQMIMSILLILHWEYTWFEVLEQIAIWGSLVLTIISLLDYILKNKDVLKK